MIIGRGADWVISVHLQQPLLPSGITDDWRCLPAPVRCSVRRSFGQDGILHLSQIVYSVGVFFRQTDRSFRRRHDCHRLYERNLPYFMEMRPVGFPPFWRIDPSRFCFASGSDDTWAYTSSNQSSARSSQFEFCSSMSLIFFSQRQDLILFPIRWHHECHPSQHATQVS